MEKGPRTTIRFLKVEFMMHFDLDMGPLFMDREGVTEKSTLCSVYTYNVDNSRWPLGFQLSN